MPPRVLEHPRQVQQVPGHERGVAVGEVVLGPAGAGVEIGRPRAGLADPAGVGLRRDGVAEVLQRVEDVHGAVLDAVLVAGDQAAADAAVVGVLAGVVEQVGVAVEPLDHLRAHRRLLAEPDRRAQHEDVGGHHPLEDRRPVVARPAVLGHVGPDAGGDLVVDGADCSTLTPLRSHDRDRAVGQALGVRTLRRALERAVDVDGAQVGEVPGRGRVKLFLRSERFAATCNATGGRATTSHDRSHPSRPSPGRRRRRRRRAPRRSCAARRPRAPQLRANAEKSELCRLVCQTSHSPARCSLAIWRLVSSTCVMSMRR